MKIYEFEGKRPIFFGFRAPNVPPNVANMDILDDMSTDWAM